MKIKKQLRARVVAAEAAVSRARCEATAWAWASIQSHRVANAKEAREIAWDEYDAHCRKRK